MTNLKANLITCLAVTVFLSLTGSRQTLAQEEESSAPRGHAAAPQASGPVDITADEQEFANDTVIARGKVRVVYRDSTIMAPLATLYKDETGNPNRAVFTGHPRLTQGRNRMDANMLTFEMAKQKVVAVGNAHSEVEIPEDQKEGGVTPARKSDNKFPSPPNVLANSSKPAKADADDDEDNPAAANQATGGTGSINLASPANIGKSQTKEKPAEKIITDSERQEFDQDSGKFEASGHVKLVNADMIVFADKMQVVYGAVSNKPETCLFSGHVIATQGRNSTSADNINYSLSTKRLQCSGNVKSKVIQEKQEKKDSKKPAGEPTAKADLFGAPANAATKKPLSGNATCIAMPVSGANDKPVWIFSDSQDYNRDGGRMAAQGNVKIVSGEMYGCGPAAVLVKKPDGKADKVYFIGRSQISQPGRRWVADEITYLVDAKKVIASGNAVASVLQSPEDKKQNRKVSPSEMPTRVADDAKHKMADDARHKMAETGKRTRG